jgi:hypothetical protein
VSSIDTLIQLLLPEIDRGKSQFVEMLRSLVAHANPRLAAMAGERGDEAFQEPLLYAHFTAEGSAYPLEQLLFGYIAEDQKPEKTSILTDSAGIVYLPRIGYFLTGRSMTTGTLSRNPATGQFKLCDGLDPIDFVFEPHLVSDTGATEICRYNHPLLDRLFIAEDRRFIRPEVASAARLHVDHLSAALTLIREYCPYYYSRLVQMIRLYVIFDEPRINSFASLDAQGAVFLNANVENDEVFFIEDIAHQGGHVIFSAATSDMDGIFDVDPHTELRRFTANPMETRTLYVVLHGLFTEVAIISCLDAHLDHDRLSQRQRHETAGRLAFALSRLATDLRNVTCSGIFQARGAALYHEFRDAFAIAYSKRRVLVQRCNFSNQPYTFSYPRFATLNPVDRLFAGLTPHNDAAAACQATH